ncbi:MAG: carbohydrate-binding protein [Firmicutes bacterium]|nr:carbohydrate-binding protein [Bacillota bacterium]
MPVTAGEKVTVKYNGLLAQSGADAVYLHAGFGQRDWHHVSDLPMTQEKPGVWSTTVSLDPNETSRFNFCFKDRANNWDNNYGLNWSVEIHNGQL